MNKTDILLYIVLPIAILLLILLIVHIVKRKKTKVKIASDELLEQIYNAFGKKENIIGIRRTQDRINFKVKDIKLIKNDILKELNISAFLKKNEVTILFKNGSKNLYDYINRKLKE